MFPFVNVHTHHKPTLANEMVLRNVMLHKISKMPQVDYSISVGLHPWYIHHMSLDSIADNLLQFAMHEQVLAIGEIGIDRAIGIDLSKQQKVFDLQSNVARALQKPVLIHAVRAHSDILPYVKKYKIPFLIHGFTGNLQQANDYIRQGAYLSFGASSFNHNHMQEVFAKLPINHCLLETDVSKKSIAEVYAAAAQAKNISVDELKEQLFTTFATIFKK